jgi:purine-binding chemotaxis protein CheW
MSAMHVRLRAGGEHYALAVANVREVTEVPSITPVPGAPPAVLGLWNLRGDVLPAIDLATLLDLSSAESSRILVAEEDGVRAGLLVESVADVAALPPQLEAAESEYLTAVALVDQSPVGVLDLSAVLGRVKRRR